MSMTLRRLASLAVLVAGTIAGANSLAANDWPEWRGPSRDGRSSETNLPARGRPRATTWRGGFPIGGRSAPVVFGNRLYLLTVVGGPADTQERLVAIEAESGKVLWDRRFSIYLSDVPQHRSAWASPAVDPETGNIYVFTVGAQLFAVSPDGKILWDRSLPEDYGAVTTHGGRTTSPIIQGRQGHPQHAAPGVGRPQSARQSLHGVRQADRADDVGQLAAGASLRHQLLDADRRRHRRRSSARRRRHRRLVPCDQGQYRRADLARRRLEARDSQQRAVSRRDRLPDPRRREHRHDRDGDDCGDRRAAQRRPEGRCVQVEDARVPADLCVAGDGRRAALHRRQQRHRRRLRSAEREAAVGAWSGHAAEGLAAPRRRQVVRRHRERPLLHPETVGDRRRSARRRMAGIAGGARGHRGIADCGRRPHLRDVDGRDICDRQARRHGSAVRRPSRRRPALRPRSTAAPAFVQIFPYESLLAPGQKQNFRLRLFDANGTSDSRRESGGRDVGARSARRRPESRRRVHGADHGRRPVS